MTSDQLPGLSRRYEVVGLSALSPCSETPVRYTQTEKVLILTKVSDARSERKSHSSQYPMFSPDFPLQRVTTKTGPLVGLTTVK